LSLFDVLFDVLIALNITVYKQKDLLFIIISRKRSQATKVSMTKVSMKLLEFGLLALRPKYSF
jgi:hypothetical protein